MREEIAKWKKRDERINYRGAETSRLDNLTDAVFGIAITLLIFNSAIPNSISEILDFTKTLPAFLLSIFFLVLIWYEHFKFSEIFPLNDIILIFLNTLFLGLVIFYMYPLRFLTVFLTNVYFQTDISLKINAEEVPILMIYYGLAVIALYFTIFLFYWRAFKLKVSLGLNEFEIFHVNSQKRRMVLMIIVPLISVALTLSLMRYSPALASILGGMSYGLFVPAMIFWSKKYKKEQSNFNVKNEPT